MVGTNAQVKWIDAPRGALQACAVLDFRGVVMRVIFFCLLNAFLFLSGCSQVTVLRTREIRAVSDENVKLQQEIRSLRTQLDSLRENQERMQRRVAADMSLVISRVTEESGRIHGRLEENNHRLDLIMGKSDKILSKRVVVDRRGGESDGDSDIHDLDLEKVYNTARSDFHRGEFKLAYDGFRQVFEKAKAGEMAENSLYWMGLCLTETGQSDKARVIFQRLMEQFAQGTKSCVALFKLAQLDEVENKPESRIAHLKKVGTLAQCAGTNEAYKAADLLKSLGQ